MITNNILDINFDNVNYIEEIEDCINEKTK
jgi:hypothetical protein